jgi:hypothetical protein
MPVGRTVTADNVTVSTGRRSIPDGAIHGRSTTRPKATSATCGG